MCCYCSETGSPQSKYANAYIYKSKYYEKIAFLSRFEKQLISYRDSLPKHLEAHIGDAANILSRCFALKNLAEVFCGYCDDTMSSALLYLSIQKAMKTKENKDDEKKEPMQTKNITLDDVQFDREELRSQLLDLLLPLCRPEAVVQMRINEDIKFCSLGESVKDQQEKSSNQMLMVITSDLECNVPIEWVHRTKKIVSFKKMSEFEKTIKEFFDKGISDD
ncbi:hypothetical protein RFI_37593, partial [Reticulomyxa filosa]